MFAAKAALYALSSAGAVSLSLPMLESQLVDVGSQPAITARVLELDDEVFV
jgi:hypothetical protein